MKKSVTYLMFAIAFTVGEYLLILNGMSVLFDFPCVTLTIYFEGNVSFVIGI